ncbi:hypothetical protein UFOVP710_8 [uncultured Caudovirales phage]|uniref:Uncharacterized protein n=1 Tax=uncultured Caudovirales phage TaxID=2100421 RepID=A0A6J5NIA5_9CAUD|nr:hypothetical protein UFOVP710_8 [uncultured Caudovirales phage]
MPTYTQIGTAVTVGAGGAADITFSTIPNTYTDLVIKFSGRNTGTESSGYTDGIIRFNGSTTGYAERMVVGLGTTTTSVNQTSTGIKWFFANSSITTASTFGNSEMYIPNYAGSTNKSVSIDTVVDNNSATVNVLALTAGLWSNTSAITSISITPGSGNWAQYSTAYLYGVSNA